MPSIEGTLPRFSSPAPYYCIPLAVCSPSGAVVVPVLDLGRRIHSLLQHRLPYMGAHPGTTVIGFAFSVPEHGRELNFWYHFVFCFFECVISWSRHSLSCRCFGADADSQPFPPFLFSSRRVGVCEEGRVVTRPPFFFRDRLVLSCFVEIEPRRFFFSLLRHFFFSSGFRIAAFLAAIAKFFFVCSSPFVLGSSFFFLPSLLGPCDPVIVFFPFSRSFI